MKPTKCRLNGWFERQAAQTTHSHYLHTFLLIFFQLIVSAACGRTITPTVPTVVSPSSVQPAALPADTPLLQVDFFDVGQGDAILVQSAEGKTALIDGGEQGSGVLAYLTERGITHIDLMVATHPHSDHIGGLVEVLGAIPVERVAASGQPHTTQLYERFLDEIINVEAEYIEVKRGDSLALGGLAFQVLSPASAQPEVDLNNNSVVLRLVAGQVAFLFTGDAQAEAEAEMIASGLELRADLLKVGHHGSSTSSSPAFLAQVKPATAVYMAGVDNTYGYPHLKIIQSLGQAGAEIYGTDTHGSITVTTDGETFEVQTQNRLRAPPVIQAVEPTAPSGEAVSLEITTLTSPVMQGETAALSAKTTPGANCDIAVHYRTGPSQASGLGPKTAGPTGAVTWSWKVGSKTARGTWRIAVTCGQNGQTATQETKFEVR